MIKKRYRFCQMPDRTYRDSDRFGRLSLYISMLAVFVAIASASFTAYQFWYLHTRDLDEAFLAIIGFSIDKQHAEDGYLSEFNMIVSNSGTTPLSIVSVSWVLGQSKDPQPFKQRKIRWRYQPDALMDIKGGTFKAVTLHIPCANKKWCDLDELGEAVYADVPAELRRFCSSMNFYIEYNNSLAVHFVDNRGHLRETIVKLGTVRFFLDDKSGTYYWGAELTKLPVQVPLFPAKKVEPGEHWNWVWGNSGISPANEEFVEGVADTTGWRYRSPEVKAAFTKWLAKGGQIKSKS